MDRYANVHSDIWLDDKFIALPDSEKLLFLYALTSPIGNYAGFYREPIAYISSAIKKSREETLELLSSLDKNNIVKYDEDNSLVLVPNYLKYNTPHSASQLKGISRGISNLPLSELHTEFLFRLNKYAPFGIEYIPDRIKLYVKCKCEDDKEHKDPRKTVLLSILNK